MAHEHGHVGAQMRQDKREVDPTVVHVVIDADDHGRHIGAQRTGKCVWHRRNLDGPLIATLDTTDHTATEPLIAHQDDSSAQFW
jgi:hypothetical protein